jgi:hypothetical protein
VHSLAVVRKVRFVYALSLTRCQSSGRKLHDRTIRGTWTRLLAVHSTLLLPVSKCSMLVKNAMQCSIPQLELKGVR